MVKPKIFVSHVSEEALLAEILKSHLSRDFLGLVDIFVSSDLESIAAGANWLHRLEQSLHEAAALLVLCSHGSLNRPWVNFEVGAAWIKSIPIVPVCHSGLRLQELPIPFSVLQGVEVGAEWGLKRVYSLIAEKLGCQVPHKDFAKLVAEVTEFEKAYTPRIENAFQSRIQKRSAARDRAYKALVDPKYKWRSIERLAILSGITEDELLELLVQDPNVVFGKSKKNGKRIARLKSREE